jgi:hypothetical protein
MQQNIIRNFQKVKYFPSNVQTAPPHTVNDVKFRSLQAIMKRSAMNMLKHIT